QVGAASEHEQRSSGLVGRADGVDDLLIGPGLDESADGSADAESGEIRELHAAPTWPSAGAPAVVAIVARARPSTLVSSTWAVMSTRAVPAESSIAPTTATVSSTTCPVAGTGTGLVKRTE